MTIKIQGLTPLIEVFDMPTSVAFYRDVIGFEVIMQYRARAITSIGGCCEWATQS